MTLKLIVEKLG